MSRWQQAFWVLLRCGLWEKEADDLTPFPLNADEWTRVYDEALRQTVQGLIYRGFQHLPEALFPPEETTAKLLMASMQAEASYRQALETTVSVSKALNAEGHDHYLLKGIASAMLYEHPELRVQGDVDFYVPSPPVKKLQTDTEGSLCYECNGMMVELHRHIIDICHPMKRKAVRKTVDMPPQEITLQNGYTLKTPQPLATLVMMNAHLLKHAITVGIGLRQFCDMARAYHYWNGQYDKRELTALYKKLGMGKWSRLMHAFLVQDLGLAQEELPQPAPCPHGKDHYLRKRIMRWGNFGLHTDTHGTGIGHTARRITANLPFSLRYAPAETLFRIARLSIGRIVSILNK